VIASLERCLIVEENFLIRQDLADMLQSLGFPHIDEAATVAQAMALIATTPHQAAFLYFIHADDGSAEVAAALRDRKIPFVVTMAYHEPDGLPLVMKGAPLITRPYNFDVLRTLLARL
jgi:two-component system, response regulator PdtaR